MTKPRLQLLGGGIIEEKGVDASVDEPQEPQEPQDEQEPQDTADVQQELVDVLREALGAAQQTIRELTEQVAELAQREQELDEREATLEAQVSSLATRRARVDEIVDGLEEREEALRDAKEWVEASVRVCQWFKEADTALYWASGRSAGGLKDAWQKNGILKVLPDLPYSRDWMEQMFPALVSTRAEGEDYESSYKPRSAAERAEREAEREELLRERTIEEGDSHEDTVECGLQTTKN